MKEIEKLKKQSRESINLILESQNNKIYNNNYMVKHNNDQNKILSRNLSNIDNTLKIISLIMLVFFVLFIIFMGIYIS